MTARRRVPVWLMGLTNLTYGMYGGAVAFAVPQLLSERHVAETSIASLTAIAFSPGFWAFLLSPVLDVRFSRRWYATVLAVVAASTMGVAVMNLDHIVVLEVVLTLGFLAAYLYQSALGGWLSSIVTEEEEKTVSVWVTIANGGGFGLMAFLCDELLRHFRLAPVAIALSVLTVLPIAVFPFMEAPGPDRRLAKESFGRFVGDVLALLKREDVLIAILLFLAPAATFSLTNFMGGLSHDFHASAGMAATAAIVGAAGGVGGALLFPALARRLPLRMLYLAIGIAGSCVTLALIVLPHTPIAYAAILVVENFFQMLAVTNSFAIALQAIGRDNPLASTTLCFILSAYGVPLSYMLYADAYGYRHGGIAGSFVVDAGAGVMACLLLGWMLLWRGRRVRVA